MSPSTPPKPRADRTLYIETLCRMTPEERLGKALELSDMTHELLRDGMRHRHPEASEAEIDRLCVERLERCRKRTC